VGLNLYRWELRNFINFVRDAGATTKTAQNLGDYNGEGLEFEFRYRVSPFLLFTGNYAYNMSVDQVTGNQMGDFPNQQAYLSQQWNFMTNWDLNAQVRWIGARMRSPTDSRAALNG
jgi:iron complex outermembrane receptor protein